MKRLPCKYFYDEGGPPLRGDLRAGRSIIRPGRRPKSCCVMPVKWPDLRRGDIAVPQIWRRSRDQDRDPDRRADRPRLYVPIDIAGDFLARTAADAIGRRFPEPPMFFRSSPTSTMNFEPAPDLPAGRRTAFFPGSDPSPTRIPRRGRRPSCAGSGAMSAKQGKAIVGVDLKKDVRMLIDGL